MLESMLWGQVLWVPTLSLKKPFIDVEDPDLGPA